MKLSTLFMLLIAGVFTITGAAGQANGSLNILAGNVGIISLGGTEFVQATVNNTGPSASIGIYKIKVTITVPSAIASIPSSGHTLPANWTILSNSGSQIVVSNGTDVLPVGSARQIFIAVMGHTEGGPSTIIGQLSYSNGIAPGSANGFLIGDIPADNSSSTAITVTSTTPVTLTDFNAVLLNCQPVLHWATEREINSDRFEIERGNPDNSGWKSIGVVAARGNATTKPTYKLIDDNLNVSAGQVLYRLKIIDKDGQYRYSEILRVFINCKSAQVLVYPNPPQNGRLYVGLTGANGYTEATLLSMSGQVILKKKVSNGTSYLNISKISNGLYVLNIKETNGIDKKVKVLIQN